MIADDELVYLDVDRGVVSAIRMVESMLGAIWFATRWNIIQLEKEDSCTMPGICCVCCCCCCFLRDDIFTEYSGDPAMCEPAQFAHLMILAQFGS